MKSLASLTLALALASLAACSHGGDNQKSTHRTNIDLTVKDFAVTPNLTDPEDPLTLTGTIENIGAETANPDPGDSFQLFFNLSEDGTLEQTEQGFAQKTITDPIPPGGSMPFTVTAPFGIGDTFSRFGNFCTSVGCLPPQTGVIGVKVDGPEDILEASEDNNFQFVTNQVVGTRVAVTMATCDLGLTGGCGLTASDGHDSVTFHLPCTGGGCSATELLMPNEIHNFITVILQLRGCVNPVCGWGVTITSETQKPGLPISKLQTSINCYAYFVNGPDSSCQESVVIRDPDY